MSFNRHFYQSYGDNVVNIRIFTHLVPRARKILSSNIPKYVKTVKNRIFLGYFGIKLTISSTFRQSDAGHILYKTYFCLVWVIIEIQKGASIYLHMYNSVIYIAYLIYMKLIWITYIRVLYSCNIMDVQNSCSRYIAQLY